MKAVRVEGTNHYEVWNGHTKYGDIHVYVNGGALFETCDFEEDCGGLSSLEYSAANLREIARLMDEVEEQWFRERDDLHSLQQQAHRHHREGSFDSPCCCEKFTPTLSGQRAEYDIDGRREYVPNTGQIVCGSCGRHPPLIQPKVSDNLLVRTTVGGTFSGQWLKK